MELNAILSISDFEPLTPCSSVPFRKTDASSVCQDLKQELKDRGLAQTGRKEDLIKRLEEALAEPAQAEAISAAATTTATAPTDVLSKVSKSSFVASGLASLQ